MNVHSQQVCASYVNIFSFFWDIFKPAPTHPKKSVRKTFLLARKTNSVVTLLSFLLDLDQWVYGKMCFICVCQCVCLCVVCVCEREREASWIFSWLVILLSTSGSLNFARWYLTNEQLSHAKYCFHLHSNSHIMPTFQGFWSVWSGMTWCETDCCTGLVSESALASS